MTAAEGAFNRFVEEVIRPVSGVAVTADPFMGVQLYITASHGSSTYSWDDETDFLFGTGHGQSAFDIAKFIVELAMRSRMQSASDEVWRRIAAYSGCKSPEELLLRLEVVG